MDALLDLELRNLHGERMPTARPRSGLRAALWTPARWTGARWSASALWAAALVVGVTVLYGVYRLGGLDSDGGGRAGTVAVDPTQDPDRPTPRPASSVFGADGAPRPIESEATATTAEELAALPVDTKALTLTWNGADGLDGLARLTRLETLRVERARVPQSTVPVTELVEHLRVLPNLQRLHLDALQDAAAGDLGALAVLPALRHVSLRGDCWQGSLASLCNSASLEALDLTAFTFADSDWQALSAAKGLRHLGLWSVENENSAVTSSQVRDLLAGLPQLASVRLAFTLLDGDIVAAVAAAQDIRALELMAPTRYAAKAGKEPVDVSPLFAIDRWTSLSLRYGGTLSPEDLAGIGRMKNLVSFELGNGPVLPDQLRIPEELGSALAGATALRKLDFMLCTVDVRWLEPLAGRPLEQIHMLARLDARENVEGARAQLEQWFPEAQIEVLPFPRQTMEIVEQPAGPGIRIK